MAGIEVGARRALTKVLRMGRVTLVGAGPGDPGLLTLAGRDARGCRRGPARRVGWRGRAATVCLVGARRRCWQARRTGVDDTGGDHCTARGRSELGQLVVRLKGGDPFLFGRGGGVAALAEAGVPVRVIPGVSSVLAAPTAYGDTPDLPRPSRVGGGGCWTPCQRRR